MNPWMENWREPLPEPVKPKRQRQKKILVRQGTSDANKR